MAVSDMCILGENREDQLHRLCLQLAVQLLLRLLRQVIIEEIILSNEGADTILGKKVSSWKLR